MNPKAVKCMQSLFALKDTIGKKETREISLLCGVTVTQVCSSSRLGYCSVIYDFCVPWYTSLTFEKCHHSNWTEAVELVSTKLCISVGSFSLAGWLCLSFFFSTTFGLINNQLCWFRPYVLFHVADFISYFFCTFFPVNDPSFINFRLESFLQVNDLEWENLFNCLEKRHWELKHPRSMTMRAP